MVLKTEGVVACIRNSGRVIYLTVFTPYGRLSCYASGSFGKIISKKDDLKYAMVELKLFFKNGFSEGMIRFPCEVIELKKIFSFTDDEVKRRIFRYACYLAREFSVVKSGERFYEVLKCFHSILRKEEEIESVKKYLFSVELFIFASEGITGRSFVCEHAKGFLIPVSYAVNKNLFICEDCVSNFIMREPLYLKHLSECEARTLYEVLGRVDLTDLESSVRNVIGYLEREVDEEMFYRLLCAWDVCFSYHFFTYVHHKRGSKFFELRMAYYEKS
mgnify:CR=1 FL=1